MSDNPFSIIQTGEGRKLRITGSLPPGFHGDPDGDGYLCPLDAQNAAAIRKELPWSAPVQVGMRKSIGCGDRLGIATPGHLRAIRDGDMFPVLAQQSMREMQRARRSPQQVLDDAMWGVIQAKYESGWACDADHLKTTEDIDACAAAGYLGYTLDPGQYVDDEANDAGQDTLESKVNTLPWNDLRDNPAQNRTYYVDQLGWKAEDYLRSAAKYSGAIARVAMLDGHIRKAMGGTAYDLEVSVDETATVTTPIEHRFIALELKRLEIPFIGLAPRFVGDFEKGVDYIGDLKAFELDYTEHAAIARELGPYKLSIHSGSDKFSVYPIISRLSGNFVHLKTAGTSWVEALRVIANRNTALFREILELAVRGYDQNRASYHVSGQADRIPQKSNAELADLLDQFDAREVLHVSFGPVLADFYDEIYTTLNGNIENYWNILRQHFDRHILPFKGH
jgi:tagaturonate epimerase